MPEEATENIFAYGSNLHLGRMRARVPSAEPIAIGHVVQRRIAFHKRSVDGSAKADAALTADPGERIWGVVYRIAARETPILDQYEFLGVGYDREQVAVVTESGVTVSSWMYVARAEAIDPAIKPYAWYLGFVVAGAHQHRLPLCYIRTLHLVESARDSNVDRQQANQRLAGSKVIMRGTVS